MRPGFSDSSHLLAKRRAGSTEVARNGIGRAQPAPDGELRDDGAGVCTGLTGGSYSNAAFHLGYECRLVGGEQAIRITNSSAENVDFIAEPLPVVALQLKDRKVREDGSTLLTITRTHRIDQTLAVHLAVGGGAAGRNDILFQGPWIVPLDLNTVSNYEIRFPAGARSSLGQAIVDVTDRLGDRITNAFVVVEPGRARVSRHRAID